MLSFAFTALSYLALTGYDGLALRHLHVKVPYWPKALQAHQLCVFVHARVSIGDRGRGPLLICWTRVGFPAGKWRCRLDGGGRDHLLAGHGTGGRSCRMAFDPIADIDHFHPLANRLIGAGVIGAACLSCLD